MPVQSASTVFGMPFRKNPRAGQKNVFKKIIAEPDSRSLNIQLPTGYGKSFVNAGVYSILKKQNRVNRLLVIVPTAAQNEQYIQDGPGDLMDACVDGPLSICDVSYNNLVAIQKNLKNDNQVFVITIQALINSRAGDVIRMLLNTGDWMITVDEYHHYGIEKSWGQSVMNLDYNFLLAMSATPYRSTEDSAFGKPDIVVQYQTGVEEGCLKPLKSHSYVYKIDAALPSGDIISYTTNELVEAAGSQSPEAIDKFRIERQMRWSPKYISPLVSFPLDRMIDERIRTGYKLQAIVGAMCVSHAEMVCEQIRTMYPELRVDWVGTGNDGRKPEENKRIIEKFCPPKVNGIREPTLDVLVHVGMAGEGLDSINVSEIVHLNKASINNSNNQENGRAARYLEGVTGHINFDSCSEYSIQGYIGTAIMDAMDNLPPGISEEEAREIIESENEYQYNLLPEVPNIRIWDLALERIDSGDPGVKYMAETLRQMVGNRTFLLGYEDKNDFERAISNLDDPIYEKTIIPMFRNVRAKEIEPINEKSTVKQWRDNINNAVRKVARYAAGLIYRNQDKQTVNTTIIKINTEKAKSLGKINTDVDLLERHYQWVRTLEMRLIAGIIPSWLR